jgi:hypothetical protein
MVVRMPMMMTRVVVTARRLHGGKHFPAAGAHETPDEHRRDNECGDKVAALAEDRSRDGRRRIGAAGGGGAEALALRMEPGEESGRSRLISRFETTAWITLESAKPSTSAQKISQLMTSVMLSA